MQPCQNQQFFKVPNTHWNRKTQQTNFRHLVTPFECPRKHIWKRNNLLHFIIISFSTSHRKELKRLWKLTPAFSSPSCPTLQCATTLELPEKLKISEDRGSLAAGASATHSWAFQNTPHKATITFTPVLLRQATGFQSCLQTWRAGHFSIRANIYMGFSVNCLAFIPSFATDWNKCLLQQVNSHITWGLPKGKLFVKKILINLTDPSASSVLPGSRHLFFTPTPTLPARQPLAIYQQNLEQSSNSAHGTRHISSPAAVHRMESGRSSKIKKTLLHF